MNIYDQSVNDLCNGQRHISDLKLLYISKFET